MKKFKSSIPFLSFIIAILSLFLDFYQNNQIKELNTQINSIEQMGGTLFLNNRLENNGVGIQFNKETEVR